MARTAKSELPDRKGREGLKVQLWGWILFIMCAFFFIISSLKNRDLLSFAGSMLFLAACFFFVVPIIKALRKRI